MNKFKKVNKTEETEPDFVFFCPGCKCDHGVWTMKRNTSNAIWTFNGDLENPTVSPSIVVRVKRRKGGEAVCHSFVKNGKIQFLGDCTHELKGQTVDLPNYD